MEYNSIFDELFYNWDELEKKIEVIVDNKEKGDIFEEFVYAFFTLNKEKYDVEVVYREKDIPDDLRDKLQLEKTDYGVDGVLVRRDGKLVAYQAKFRTGRVSAPYSELATFWAESEYADYRCIFSNCYDLPIPSDKKKHQFTILVDQLIELDKFCFENLYNLIHEQAIKNHELHTPKPHQEKIINEVISGFESNDRGKIIAACATGKTITSLWIHEKMNAKTILFIVPNLALIKQTLKEWMEQASEPFSYLCVCSDTSVVNSSNYDESKYKVSNLGIPVTTSPNDIEDFLTKTEERKRVIFSTYQSLDALTNAMSKIPDIIFDIGIFDEAHRTAGTKDSEMFVYGMYDKYIPIQKRLFMTATERIVSARVKKIAADTEYDVFSMDDEKLYGKTFSEISFGEAIEQQVISDYKVVVCCMDEDELLELIEKNYYVTDEYKNVATAQGFFKQILLAKCLNELDAKKVITFHSTVERAQSFIKGSSSEPSLLSLIDQICHEIRDDRDLYLGHVNGSMTAGSRRKILEQFEKSKYGIISNARCLIEGVDVPVIDAIYFADPKNSLVDIIQAIGRALRKTNEKNTDYSYIIIPIIIPSEATDFSSVNTESFNTLHSVLQALRDQDQVLAECINDINYEAATKGHTAPGKTDMLNGKIKLILPPKIAIIDFAEGLSLRIAEVNKDPSNIKGKLVIVEGPRQRKSSYKRVFRTIGDYNKDAYRDSLVLPTLNKFDSIVDIKTNSELKKGHNNVSHTEKLGLIEKKDKLYSLSNLGQIIYQDDILFDDIFREQLLKYHEIVIDENETYIFPYRAILKIFLEFDHLTKFEFIYCIYSLVGTTEIYINEAIARINYLRETYPEIEILSEENKKKVLDILNNKYDLPFSFKDIWTSRTVVYNQFNYFKKHLWLFDSIFVRNEKVNDRISKIEGSNDAITNLLNSTKIIEDAALNGYAEDVKALYVNKIL